MYRRRRTGGRIRNPRAYAAAVKRNARGGRMGGRRRAAGGIRRIGGRGDYKDVLKYVIRGLGGLGGGVLGGLSHGPAGAGAGFAQGYGLGGHVSRLLGFGDYRKSRANKGRAGPGLRDQVPSFSTGMGTVRVQHREFLGDIYGSTGFVNTSFQLNPANIDTFPWLSQIAVNFEQWKPRGIVFEYRTMSSDTQVGSTTSLGSVVLATEYNALAAGFTTKQQMENSQFVVSVKPSKSVIHPIECKLGMTPNQPLYVRLPGVIPGGDPRLYDLGNFQIATVGFPTGGQNIGELWVSYDFELLKPILGADEPASIQSKVWDLQGLQAGFANGATPKGLLGDPTSPTGQVVFQDGFDPKLTPVINVSNSIVFPVGCDGNYLVELSWYGDTQSVAGQDIMQNISATRGTLLQFWASDAGPRQSTYQTQYLNTAAAGTATVFHATALTISVIVNIVNDGVNDTILYILANSAVVGNNYPTGSVQTYGQLVITQMYTPPPSALVPLAGRLGRSLPTLLAPPAPIAVPSGRLGKPIKPLAPAPSLQEEDDDEYTDVDDLIEQEVQRRLASMQLRSRRKSIGRPSPSQS